MSQHSGWSEECVYNCVYVCWCDGYFAVILFQMFCGSNNVYFLLFFSFCLFLAHKNTSLHPDKHTQPRVTCKALVSDGWSAGQSAVLIIGPGEVGGAAAVIRAFWCGLAQRKGHPLNISGRTTSRDREGWTWRGDCPQTWQGVIGRVIVMYVSTCRNWQRIIQLYNNWTCCVVSYFIYLLVMISLYSQK